MMRDYIIIYLWIWSTYVEGTLSSHWCLPAGTPIDSLNPISIYTSQWQYFIFFFFIRQDWKVLESSWPLPWCMHQDREILCLMWQWPTVLHQAEGAAAAAGALTAAFDAQGHWHGDTAALSLTSVDFWVLVKPVWLTSVSVSEYTQLHSKRKGDRQQVQGSTSVYSINGESKNIRNKIVYRICTHFPHKQYKITTGITNNLQMI